MIWAVDGPDNIGKSTALLKAVADKQYQVYVHSSRWPGNAECWAARLEALADVSMDTAMDRFFLSEFVYSDLRGEKPLMTWYEAKSLMADYRRIFVPEAWVWAEGSPTDRDTEELNAAYFEHASGLSIPVREIPWRGDIGRV